MVRVELVHKELELEVKNKVVDVLQVGKVMVEVEVEEEVDDEE